MARQYDLDVVRRLESDAIGVPGQRRFRVIAQNERETAFLWLEKEQLQALGLAVDQLLTPIKPVWSASAQAAAPPARPFEGRPTIEMRVGRLGLGYDESAKLFILIAHEIESESDDQPNFRCMCSRGQLSHLSESIGALTSGGRPRCPLCGQPLSEEPHLCPSSNGHGHHE